MNIVWASRFEIPRETEEVLERLLIGSALDVNHEHISSDPQSLIRACNNHPNTPVFIPQQNATPEMVMHAVVAGVPFGLVVPKHAVSPVWPLRIVFFYKGKINLVWHSSVPGNSSNMGLLENVGWFVDALYEITQEKKAA